MIFFRSITWGYLVDTYYLVPYRLVATHLHLPGRPGVLELNNNHVQQLIWLERRTVTM